MYKAMTDVSQGRWELGLHTCAVKLGCPLLFSIWWDREERYILTHPSLKMELQRLTEFTDLTYLL